MKVLSQSIKIMEDITWRDFFVLSMSFIGYSVKPGVLFRS